MTIRLASLDFRPPYGLHATFDDGSEREIDLEPDLARLEPAIRDAIGAGELTDTGDTVVWGGTATLDAAVLHGDEAAPWGDPLRFRARLCEFVGITIWVDYGDPESVFAADDGLHTGRFRLPTLDPVWSNDLDGDVRQRVRSWASEHLDDLVAATTAASRYETPAPISPTVKEPVAPAAPTVTSAPAPEAQPRPEAPRQASESEGTQTGPAPAPRPAGPAGAGRKARRLSSTVLSLFLLAPLLAALAGFTVRAIEHISSSSHRTSSALSIGAGASPAPSSPGSLTAHPTTSADETVTSLTPTTVEPTTTTTTAAPQALRYDLRASQLAVSTWVYQDSQHLSVSMTLTNGAESAQHFATRVSPGVHEESEAWQYHSGPYSPAADCDTVITSPPYCTSFSINAHSAVQGAVYFILTSSTPPMFDIDFNSPAGDTIVHVDGRNNTATADPPQPSS